MQSNNEAQPPVNDLIDPEPGWFAKNIIPLVAVAAIVGLLIYYDAALMAVGMVAVGLGLVIFIHELGHFVAAKLCDVHVEAFSIGFGPSLPGCEVKWGETTYKVGMIPLGGYVKMVGEGTDTEEGEDDPRSYKNKSVGQRMAIISAGVIMNMILATCGFVGVYMTAGEERPAGIIGAVEAGSPAWQLGLRSGAVLTRVGSVNNPFFDDVKPEVVLSSEGQKVPITFTLPGSDKPIDAAIEPKFDADGAGIPLIGVSMASTTSLYGSRRTHEPPVVPASAASLAKPALQSGDQVVATTDPANPSGPLKELPRDPRHPDREQRDYFEFWRRMVQLAGQPVTIRTANSQSGNASDVTVPAEFHRDLGMIMKMGQIVAVRDGSPAARAGVRPQASEGGDRIKQVEVAKPSGGVIRWVTVHSTNAGPDVDERTLDPMRLPDELKKWAATAPGKKTVTLLVSRDSGHSQDATAEIKVDWEDGWEYAQETHLNQKSPLSITGLGLAYCVELEIREIVPGSTAEKAGLKVSDVIKGVQFYRGTAEKPEPSKPWYELKDDQWVWTFDSLHHSSNSAKVGLRVQRGKDAVPDVVLEPTNDTTWPMASRGFIFRIDTRLQKATSIGEALGMGGRRVVNFAGQIYRSLKSIVMRRISFNKHASGPISIAVTSYDVAGDSIPKFILFMSILSVNLAVINFLPIPLLDGGHMVFLLYEKFRGKPAPESVRVAATFAGMALIGSLMLYVIVLDVMKYVF